jgi:hypothetical protein
MLVKFTYAGDCNLDGMVTIYDLGELASHWQETGAVWRYGDSNYDTTVTITDLGDLMTNWQAGVGSPLGPQGGDEGADTDDATNEDVIDLIDTLNLSDDEMAEVMKILDR